MSTTHELSKARKNKADEFYTSLEDITKEVEAYPPETWKGKIVYMPCDDPERSQFWYYFKTRFEELGCKKIVATYLSSDPYKVIYDGRETRIPVKSGDFRDCTDLMKESDIIVTNPPFSLFRVFMDQVAVTGKQFLILGNINAVTNKAIFSMIMDNKLWFGSTIHSGDREFMVPDNYPLETRGSRVDEQGRKFIRVKGVRWFTNIEYPDRYKVLSLSETSDPDPFDNYSALNVTKTKDIPKDYAGVMGVPITFLDKYNPDQFEILGLDVMMLDNPRPNKRLLYKGKETYCRIMIHSKPLAHPDVSAFEFHKRIFGDTPTPAINFDSLWFHPQKGYYVLEYLLCDEHQIVTPWTSHPNRYWHKNWRKFVSLFKAAQQLGGHLILINYAKEGTAHDDKIKIIEVKACDREHGITDQDEYQMSFEEFRIRFSKFAQECGGAPC